MISSVVVGVIVLILVRVVYKHSTRSTLAMIRGPKAQSLILGNLPELLQRPVGEADFTWQSQYGNVVRFKGALGEDQLLVTDPKALHKILNTSAYTYWRTRNARLMTRMLIGRGIAWADGEDHKRHRKVMAPGFGPKESEEFLPTLKECAESISVKWLEAVENGNGRAVLNVLDWLLRGALDAIGQAAFDVQFGAIGDESHPLAKKFENYFGDVLGLPSAKQIFIQRASEHIPTWLFEWVINKSSNPRITRLREVKAMTIEVAKELVREKSDALLQGKGSRDIFSLLLKANMDVDAKNKLTEEELLAQMSALLIAGHETTANTISWILLELARNHEVQSRLRNEVRETEATIQTRNSAQLTVADLDAMPYLNAVIKEGLRFHAVVPHTWRMACRNDILPLSKPILTNSGDMIDEIPVPEGTQILVSIAAYNRDKDLWGEDAHEFNPNRWLDIVDENKSAGIGVYSHSLAFLSGARACLGWRFAVLELQVFLFELLGKFVFTTTDKTEQVYRLLAVIMTPAVNDGLDHGIQMPLAVSIASQDG